MTEQKEQTKPTKPLTLSTTRTGAAAKGASDATQVRQKFSHGRTRVVEVVAKKPVKRPPGAPAPVAAAPAPAPAAGAKAPAAPTGRTLKLGGGAATTTRTQPARPSAGEIRSGGGAVLKTLTEEEKEARQRALVDANRDAEVARQRAAQDAARRAIEDEARRKADDEHKKRLAEEDARKKSEEEVKRKTDALVQKRLDQAATASPQAPIARQAEEINAGAAPQAAPAAPAAPIRRPLGAPGAGQSTESALRRPPMRPAIVNKRLPQPPGARREVPKRRSDKVDVGRAVEGENDFRSRSAAQMRRRLERDRRREHASEPQQKVYREVTIPETITVQELAQRMSERSADVVKTLMRMGVMATINQAIDPDTAELVVTEMGHRPKRVAEGDVETGLAEAADAPESLLPRPPVVTIMGHVDHGKTSLLDALRATDVAAHEAGGITQHIGAYQVTLPSSQKITFLDTPGHEAFTAMRARGAKVTDIVVLVVAADDGVMPQTVEAINHAKAAKVPMIVAINKIDKPDAKPERVRTELLQHEVQVESFGGEVVDVEVSAKNKTNLDKLLEMIALQAELLDLKTNSERPAEGTVIEAKLDRGRGPVATVLVQRGTLRVGDIIVAGAEMGRVRALISDQGENLDEAGPSVPVEVLGFNGPPEAGDRLAVVENEARARQVTSYRAHQKRENAAASISGMRGSLEQMMSQLKTAGRKEFPLIVKADVQGSLEAILGSLEKLGTEEVAARILHAGVGGISESDVTLAEGFNAAIIGFSVRANKEAAAAAKRNGIEIRYYNIIYDLVDDVKKAMSGLLAPTLRETMLGNAQILEVFNISKVGKVAGCRVTDGTVERGANVRLIRDNVVVHEGKLSTLKRFKDEVKEVQSGQECGMAFENYGDMRPGDVIECYRVETIQRSL